MCHGFGVCGEAVFFVRSSSNRHCFSEDSEAVALLTYMPSRAGPFRRVPLGAWELIRRACADSVTGARANTRFDLGAGVLQHC